MLPVRTRVAAAASINEAGLDLIAFCNPFLAGALRFGDVGSLSPGMSSNTTRQPAEAARAAMPLPIAPAPTTPTVVMRIQDSLRKGPLQVPLGIGWTEGAAMKNTTLASYSARERIARRYLASVGTARQRGTHQGYCEGSCPATSA